MLIYSNKTGMPGQLNIYQDKPGEWTLETMQLTKSFHSVGQLFECLRRERLMDNSILNAVLAKAEETAAPLSWTQLGTSEDTLSAALSDCVIEHVEPISYPLTDGILLYAFDRNNKPRVLEISIEDGFLNDPDNFGGIPLSVRLSSVIGE